MSDFKLSGNNFDSVEEDISTLKELFPSIVNGDNEIDFDELREIFEKNGETVVDDSEEYYKFTWWGKKEAKHVAKASTSKTLRPSKKDSKNWEDTDNIYIEGDNLEVLKVLLGSYRNSIKMIYIDPPYNTGKDFVYHDNLSESIKEHLESTNQLNEEGKLLENPKTEGKYHSNWLNMIYPRLYLAKKLLSKDGVIFISIDDNEISNLKKICDEIFGEVCFIGNIVRKRRQSQANLSKNISPIHEYILIYGKKEGELLNRAPANIDESKYKNPDNDERGPYVTMPCTNKGGARYSIKTPTGRIIDEEWRFKEETYWNLYNDNKIVFPRGGEGKPRYKLFLEEKKKQGVLPNTWLDNISSNQEATKEIKNIFDGSLIFDTPKPTELIEYLIQLGSNDDDYILDFFSGSATTAEAVIKCNYENNSNRKFILIQIPELTPEKSTAFKSGYKNICEIGKERIRRAGDKILEKSGNKDLDIGFKVFKVDESNFIPWNPLIESENDAKQAILTTGNNIVDGRSELDLIYELLLKLNMELTCSIEEKNINNHKIYVIDEGYALICLDSNIDESITNDLLQLKEDLMTEHCEVILRDDALDDNLAINIYETLKTNNMEFHTI